MKHFSVSTPVSATPAGSAKRNDDDAMTQEGFKRFRRRKSRDHMPNEASVGEAETRHGHVSRPDVAPMTLPPEAMLPPATEALPDPAEKPEVLKLDPTPIRRQHATVSQPAQRLEPEVSDQSAPANPRLKPAVKALHPRLMPDHMEEPPVNVPKRFDVWAALPRIPFDPLERQRSRLPLVSAFRTSPTARAFDLLRTRLLQNLKLHDWKRVAITSPGAGGGTTFCATNLALSLSRVPGNRTLLMDMNLRSPGVAAALGIAPQGDMARFLGGEVSLVDHLQRLSETLAVATNGLACPDASEVFHNPRCEDVVTSTIEATAADTVIFDLPPVLELDDVAAFLPQVDGVILVSDGEASTAADLAACERMFGDQTPLLGVVLNRARRAD